MQIDPDAADKFYARYGETTDGILDRADFNVDRILNLVHELDELL